MAQSYRFISWLLVLVGALAGASCLYPERADLDANSPLGALLNSWVFLDSGSGTAFYVSATLGNDSNTGQTAAQPLKTLQRALDLFQGQSRRNRINMAAGTYATNATIPDNPAVTQLTIAGGYNDTFTQRTPFTTISTISTNSGFAQAINITGESVRLEGLSITGGDTGAITAAVVLTNGQLILHFSVLVGNNASGGNLGLHVLGGNATVRNSVLSGGALGAGLPAGIQVSGGTVIVRNSLLKQAALPGVGVRGIIFSASGAGSVIEHTSIDLTTNTPGGASNIGIDYGSNTPPVMQFNIIDVTGTPPPCVSGTTGTINNSCLRSVGGATLTGGVASSGPQTPGGFSFAAGPAGQHFDTAHFISTANAGVCIDFAGAPMASALGVDSVLYSALTTHVSLTADNGVLDVGFHYPIDPLTALPLQ